MRDRVIKTVDEALVKSRAFELAGKCYAGIRQERLEAEF
jgi:lysylphosphatidylglycerol synthetase-like protein (DUF2156 family)